MAGTALSGTALLVSLTVAVPAIGFFEDGVAAESIATTWQATIGDVEKESLFATFQSLAARRKLLSILVTGLPVVGNVAVASAAFCSKIDEIQDATVDAAHMVANASAAALKQIQQAAQAALTQTQQAAQDSGAVDRLEAAADATTVVAGAAKETADKIVAEAEKWAEKATKEAADMAREAANKAAQALSPAADAAKRWWEEVTDWFLLKP